MFSRPMEYSLRFLGLWSGHNNNLFYIFFILLNIVTVGSQIWNVTTIYDNLEIFSSNISNIIMVTTLFVKIIISWRKQRYMKEVLVEMMDDWCQIKKPEQLLVMKNHVQFSHKFFVCTLVMYNFTILMFPIVALQTYFTESNVENRRLPLLVKFPFPIKKSPFYEIIYISQAILLILVGNIYVVLDSSYAAMIMHAATKLEIIRFELENFVNNVLKLEKKSTINILFQKHHEVTQFAIRVDEIFSLQLFFNFSLSTLQLCFNGFMYLMNLSENNLNMLLKDTFLSMSVLTQLGIYCALGEYLQSKCYLIAESAYFIPWYELKYNDAKIILMFIQRAQKPSTITAGKFIGVSHVTFLKMIKTGVSYLSVLRAARV